MNFDMLYKDAIDKHFEELMVKKVVSTIVGTDIYESHEEHYTRLNIIHSNFLKINGQDTVFAHFICSLEKAVNRIPAIPAELIFDFALEEFKKKKYPEGFFRDWLEKSKETIINEYIEFKAYDIAITKLYYIINPIVENNIGLGENINSNNNNKRISKKGNRTNNNNIKWTGTDEQLVKLYNSLYQIRAKTEKNYNKSNYIDCPDFKIFEFNFKGKKVSDKIIWLKTLGELVFLMDNLSAYIDNSAYQKENDKIKPIIKNHFCLIKNGEIRDIIGDQTIYDARSRFEKSLEKGIMTRKRSSKILSRIQGI